MWRNYLIVGLRALAKNRVYAAINIVGLAVGIAACLLILSYVRYEFSYDAWLPNSENTYQLQTIYLPSPQGGLAGDSQATAVAAEAALKKDFPQLADVVWLSSQNPVFLQNGQPTTPGKAYITDGEFFDVVRVPFVRGNPATALADPHSMVMSETEARNQFGGDNPIGKTITVASGDIRTDYRVTGVFEDLPKNSSFDMTVVMRVDPVEYFRTTPGVVTSWTWQTGAVYFRTRPGTDPATIQSQLPAWEKRNIPDDPASSPKTNPGDYTDFRVVNVRDIHLSKAPGQGRPLGDRQSTITFGIVALLILAMACMNFTNLATARASQRAREVALRKVLGANRRQLILQFLSESLVVSLIAMLIALAIAELAIRPLNVFLDADMALRYFGSGGIILPLIALTAIVGLAGGLYPAIYLSRFEPARILKANKSAADAEGSGRLRNLLVVSQFAVSIGLIVCTAVIYAQTAYARSIDAGYNRDGLLQVAGIGRPQIQSQIPTFVQEVRKLPGVADAALVGLGIATGNNSTTDVNVPGAQPVTLGIYAADTHSFATLGMKLLAGRNFSESIAMDDSTTPSPPDPAVEKAFVARGTNVILSEQAAERLGFKTPQAAIGKTVQLTMASPELGAINATVIGVVSDVRYRSVRDPIQPIVYYYQTTGFSRLLVRTTGDAAAVNARVEALWKRLVPEAPYQARFASDIVNDLYNADEKRAQLFGMFAILAVVIGCLGLFGLAAFTAERRTKEIGIRKAMGAGNAQIVALLLWQFAQPVLWANVIAWPVAWWLMRRWLSSFAYHIDLHWWVFAVASLGALLIALATVAGQAFLTARAKPVLALRTE